jgi:hypothetical protein
MSEGISFYFAYLCGGLLAVALILGGAIGLMFGDRIVEWISTREKSARYNGPERRKGNR